MLKHLRRSLQRSFASPHDAAAVGPKGGRLYVMAVLFVILCLLGLYALVTRRGALEAQADAERLSQAVADALSDQISYSTQTVDLILLELAGRPERGPAGGVAVAPPLSGLLQDAPQLRALLVTDATGRVIQSSVPMLVGQSVGDRDWFRLLRVGGQQLRLGSPEAGRFLAEPGRPRPIPETGLWSIPLARGLRNWRGEFEGAVVALLNPDHLGAIARQSADSFGVTVRLHSPNGALLARSSGGGEGIGLIHPNAWPFRFLPRQERGSFSGTDQDGVEVIGGFAVTRQGLMVVEAARPRAAAFEGVRALALLLGFGLAA
ncbi:MAG TPA: cache domain-containing protein, partial [Roseococcus sp.]|nr:cache domain-containing protein [Roseococcus sp.]